MREDSLAGLLQRLGSDHQVFRIIQLDRRSGVARIPTAIINWSATVELIMKGSNTQLDELPLT